jgi:hypothetical protein
MLAFIYRTRRQLVEEGLDTALSRKVATASRSQIFDGGTPEQIDRRFVRGRAVTVEPLMESLAALGQTERGEDGRFAA